MRKVVRPAGHHMGHSHWEAERCRGADQSEIRRESGGKLGAEQERCQEEIRT